MQFNKYSPDTVAELLIYLAENENFSSLKAISGFTKKEVSNVLGELADQLKVYAANQPIVKKESMKKTELAENASRVIANLTPHEESVLLRSFRIA